MTRQPFAMSPSYLAVIDGIRKLHRLTLDGQDESPLADAIRDSIDGPWEALSEAERKRVSGLSEDLYSISDPSEQGPQVMNPQALAKLNDAVEARAHGDWDRSLGLLRRWGKHVPRALVSYLRGAIWLEAGDPETAVLFYEHAAELEPENGNYLAVFLHALKKVEPARAQSRAEQILQSADIYPPVAVATAANVAFMVARSAPESEVRRLIPVLERTLTRIEEGDESGVDRLSYAMAEGLLGFCHELVGEFQAAVESYSRCLQFFPGNVGLRVARGILLYGSSPRAITDFELAIQNDSPVVWPFFFLAHHYLMSGRYEDCRAMCERASRMPASDAVKSELAEWAAISQAELGFPAEMVRGAFEHSIRLDPSNDRARRNLAIFEKAARPPRSEVWERRREAAVRALGMAAHQHEWPYERAAA
jgi:tetratricopeptide (TPR) repeat protein